MDLTAEQHSRIQNVLERAVASYKEEQTSRGVHCFQNYEADLATADAEYWNGPATERVFRKHTHTTECWCHRVGRA